jgi:hypothetical protein
MDSDGSGRRTEDGSDLLRSITAVVVEDERGALLRGELVEDLEELDRILRRIGHGSLRLRGEFAALLQLSRGDPERGRPDPAIRAVERGTASEGLHERLAERVARDRGFARVRDEGTPHARRLLAPDARELVARSLYHGIVYHVGEGAHGREKV